MHLADAFIQSDLHCIQVAVFLTFYQLLLSLGIEPMILALLTPCSTIWATGKLQESCFYSARHLIFLYCLCVFQCTVSCGGGVQTRSVECLRQGRPSVGCLPHQRPISSRACNTHFCPGPIPAPVPPPSPTLKGTSWFTFTFSFTDLEDI